MVTMLRHVTFAEKNVDGTIAGLAGPDWGYRPKGQIVQDILTGIHAYRVWRPPYPEVDIHVVDSVYGPYLRTEADESIENNLGVLGDLT